MLFSNSTDAAAEAAPPDAGAGEELAPAAPSLEKAADEPPAVPAQDNHVHVKAKGLEAPQRPARLEYTAPGVDGEAGRGEPTRSSDGGAGAVDGDYAEVSRNAPCPCGSGKKFKRCHGDPKVRETL
nr:SEC-C metal-binding domain-containing protein [Motilibacter aurantiacus]